MIDTSFASNVRGLRNNNPGNLRPSGDNWLGMVGVDNAGSSDGYLIFDSPESGIRAMTRNLMSYANRGLTTTKQIIERWAPAADNNNTEAYISSVAGRLGVDRNSSLDLSNPTTMKRLVDAIIRHENGAMPYSDQQLESGIAAAGLGQRSSATTQTQSPQDSSPASVPQSFSLRQTSQSRRRSEEQARPDNNPFAAFLNAGREAKSPELDTLFAQFVTGQTPEVKSAPSTIGEKFSAGVEAGTQGLIADFQYFKALGNTLAGDDQAAADNIRAARVREELAAAPLEGLETFEQFLEEPTLEGFLTQAVTGTGQVLPSAMLSIASAGTGAVAAVAGRAVITQAGKQAAKRIIKDSVERSAKGVADQTEQQIAELAYGALRRTAKTGAITGAFGAEYAPISGSNLSEALDAGQTLNSKTALRAATVAVPQAAIGVGSEYALLKLIGQQATKRAAVEGGIFSNLAKRIGTGALAGGAIEASTEVAQESISVANRADLDPLFTAEDAQLRLAQAAFVGFFGGAAPGGAGGAIGGSIDAVSRGIPTGTGGRIIDTAANVYDKVASYINKGREQRVNDEINKQQFGDMYTGNTSPEPEGDIKAQLRAMIDQTSGKDSVWIAGESPVIKARENEISLLSIAGETAYAAMIPGRGTIVSTNPGIVQEVIAAGASDQSLQKALGYSATKDYSNPGDIVVQVLDRDGRVISEEVTTAEGREAAYGAALKLRPDGGKIEETTVEKALEDRKRRFEAERPVEVRDIEFTEDQLNELRFRMQAATEDGQVDEVDPNESDVDTFAQGIQTAEGQRTIVRAYGRKADPTRTFDNTAAARAAYESVFGETNWADPRFASMTEAMLNAAANEQRSNPDSAVSIEDTPDGGFQLVRDDFGDLFNSIDKDGNEVRLNLPAFLRSAIQRAKQSKYARNSRVTIVAPDGKKSAVNLVDLTAAGQRLLEGREGTGFQMRQDRQGNTFIAPEAAARAGLLEILGDLAIEGYDVQIDGQSLFPGFQLTPDRNPAANNRIPAKLGNVTAAIVGGKQRSLNELLNPQQDPISSAQERQAELIAEPMGPPQDDIADGRSEIDRMIESSVEGGELLTPMNIDTPRSAIDRRAGSAPSTINPERANERVSSAINNMVREIINDLFIALNFKSPPRILSFAELDAMPPQQLEAMFPQGLAAIKLALEGMRNTPSVKGRHISGEFGKVIILRESGNPLQDALVVAHEIGHSLYKEERDNALSNKALRQRLIKAYQNSSVSKGLTEKYGFDRGFEEWFSDQVALWATKRYKNRQAKNMVEKFFKDFVSRLDKLWRSTAASFRRRIGEKVNENSETFGDWVNQDFESFMDSILESRRTQVKDNGLSFTEKAFVYELRDLEVQSGGQALAAHWRKSARNILRNPKIRLLLKVVMTADGILRIYGNSEIADMFYVRSQQDGSNGALGMLRAAARKTDGLQNDFERRIGALDDPAVVDGFAQAASSTPTAELTGKAREIRAFLDELYDQYIAPSNTDIGRQRDYFPVALNLLEIDGRPDEFVDLIVANNPSIDRAAARKAVDHLQRVQQAIRDDKPIEVDPTNPAADVAQAILLTKGIPREVLQQAGFLLPPADAFIKYIRHVVKRVEWDRHTKDAEGNSKLEPLLARLAPEDQALAREIISAYLGYQTKPLSPMFRKLNSYGQFLQFITILPFATLASLTDLAGPVINSKEFGSVTTAFKEIAATIKNRQEAAQFARDLGVVTNETVANAWITEAEQDYMDPKVRKMSDVYFRMIGLDFFTRFSREFAAGMGVQFILKHAHNEFSNPRSERYLRELGLTSAEVLAWERGGRKLTTPEGMKVKQGLQRFVESSILRPNAAERPLWASDPHWALVWQLKSYFYSYGKVILGGIKREASTRLKEGDGTPFEKMTAAGAVLALTAIATMPLAMLGMELREYAKYGMAWLLPGVEPSQRYFRSDRMDWPEYLGEVFDRSGFLGPIGLFTMANQSARYGDNPIITLLGPTAETIDTTISNGWRVDRTIKDRLLPLYNQLY